MTDSIKRAAHGVSAFAIAFASMASAAPAAVAATFSDVSASSEFYSYVESLYNAGVISGVTPTTFEPMRNMSRGEVAKVAVRAKAMAINTAGGPHFSDVPASNTFYSYIETLANAGVVSGFGDGTFRPLANVTRGEFSKIVTRTWNMPIDLTGGPHFKDVGSSNAAYQYIETLRNNNIISGYPDGNFRPDWPILRQEVAKMADRTMKLASGDGFNPGTGARLDVQANATQVVADCVSAVTFTVTSYDEFGNVDASFTDNVTVKTSLGTFSGSGTNEETVKAATGRAQFTLTSCTAGTATVVATAGSRSSSGEVRFSTSAQGPNQGIGPTCVTGTGCMEVSIVSDKLLTAGNANDNTAGQLEPVIGGWSTVQAYLYDSNGDPLTGADIRCTIVTNTGNLGTLGSFPDPGFPAATENRSITLSDEGDGLYYGTYAVVNNQIPGTVQIECTNLNSSPALSAKTAITVAAPVVKAWVADNTLLTGGVTLGEPTGDNGNQTITAVFATVTDQFGDPRTISCAGAVDDLQVRVTAGPSDLQIGGVSTNMVLTPVAPGQDNSHIQGLYFGELVTGMNAGSVTLEVRADQCTGQPRATTNLTISNPKLELFSSSTTVGAGGSSIIVAKLTDQNGKAITGENLEANIQTGPATVTAAMTDEGNGFYTTDLTAFGTIATSQPIVVRVTDLDRNVPGNPLQGTVTLTAAPSNLEGSVNSMTLSPTRTTVGLNQSVTVMVMLRDTRGNGVDAACGDVTVTPVVGSMTVAGLTTPATPDGLCFVELNTETAVGNARVQIRYELGSILRAQEVSFSIRDVSIDAEAVDARLTFGEGSGTIVYIRDEVGDSVSGVGNVDIVASDTRVNVSVLSELGISGSYFYGFQIPEDIAASSFTIRSTVRSPDAATNPTDSVSITGSPVTISLKARPTTTITGTCILIEAVVKNASGAPVTGAALTFEIASATGGNGTLLDGTGNACATGTQRVTGVTDNGPVSNDGIYYVTYVASDLASTDVIRAYLPNLATTPESTVTVNTR